MLVIDDEQPIRHAVRFVLEDEGYVVLEAPDGRVGFDLLRESDKPLIILLDLLMPGRGGLELLRLVADEPDVADHHAFILFSASQEFTARAVQAAIPPQRLFHLSKPFDLDDLVAVVGQAARHLDGARDAG